MLLPHKELDTFIKKYNNTFSMSGYSRMNLKDKNNLVESRVKAVMASKLRPNDARLIKAEYARIKSKHAEKMKKLDDDTKPKATPAPKRALPKVPKKKATADPFPDTVPVRRRKKK